MDERTQGALMLAVGGVAVRLGLTDAALNYIRPTYRPLLVVAGVALVVLGVGALVRALRRPEDAAGPAVRDEAYGDVLADHDHSGHTRGEGPRVAWLLALPLFAILLIAPPPLGAFAANRQSGVVQSQQVAYPPLPPPQDGAVELTLGEYSVRALYDTAASLEGERVRLLGFVSEHLTGDRYLLTRFQIACCAADGTAISVEVRGDPQPRQAEQWLVVEGIWQPREGHVLGELTTDPPVIVADAVSPTVAPAEPYEY